MFAHPLPRFFLSHRTATAFFADSQRSSGVIAAMTSDPHVTTWHSPIQTDPLPEPRTSNRIGRRTFMVSPFLSVVTAGVGSIGECGDCRGASGGAPGTRRTMMCGSSGTGVSSISTTASTMSGGSASGRRRSSRTTRASSSARARVISSRSRWRSPWMRPTIRPPPRQRPRGSKRRCCMWRARMTSARRTSRRRLMPACSAMAHSR